MKRRAFVKKSGLAAALIFLPHSLSVAETLRRRRPSDLDWPSEAAWKRLNDDERMMGRHFLGPPNLAQLRNPGYLASGLFSIDRFERFRVGDGVGPADGELNSAVGAGNELRPGRHLERRRAVLAGQGEEFHERPESGSAEGGDGDRPC